MRPCGSPLLQLVAVCCPDGCDEVSDTGKGLGPLRGSGLHTPAYGNVTGVVRAWTAARFGRSFGGGEHPGLCGTDCRRDSPASPAGPQDGSPCGPDQRHGAGRSWLSRDSSRGPRTERSMAGNPSLPGDVGITEGPLTGPMSPHDDVRAPWSATPGTGVSVCGQPGFAVSTPADAQGGWAFGAPGLRLGTFLVPSAGLCGMLLRPPCPAFQRRSSWLDQASARRALAAPPRGTSDASATPTTSSRCSPAPSARSRPPPSAAG